jgi:ABC-type uncharacterized transport system auxiliary subunit
MTQHPAHSLRVMMAAMASAIALSGCISVLPSPDAPKALYRLNAIAPGQVAPLRLDVAISEPDAGRAISGVDLAVLDGQGGLRFMGDFKWSDPATRLIQTATISALAGSGGEGTAVSMNEGARTDLELRWRIDDLAIHSGSGLTNAGEAQAICTLSMTVLDARTRRPIAQRTETRMVPVGGGDLARVQGLQRVAADAALAAAQFVSETAQSRADAAKD